MNTGLSLLFVGIGVVLTLYAAGMTLFSAFYDRNVTAVLYLAAVVSAIYGCFDARALLVALACIAVAHLTSWRRLRSRG